MDFWQHCVGKAGADVDPIDVAIDVAALFMVPGVIAEVEREATNWVQRRLADFAVDIKNTTGATRDAFRRAQERTAQPEVVTVDLRQNLTAATRKSGGDVLPTFPGHLFADASGEFPAELNTWEREVLQTESARQSFVAWYRNPSRPTPASLRIGYKNDSGLWTSLQVDFLVMSRRSDGTLGVSILDPHGGYLADTRAKLRALAEYAESFGTQFVRIESIVKVGDQLRVLDLHEAAVRSAVLAFDGAQVSALYEGKLARDYR
jgi:hypothetical protein